MEIKGVDLSYCQKGIDYRKLKESGVKYAIIRAGFAEVADKCAAMHVNGCREVGIPYGFYWYSYADSIEAVKREAAACLNVITAFNKPEYPVFFDGEENSISNSVSRKTMTDIALAFVEEIEKGGYPCGIYANPNWMENCYEKARIIEKADIWLAHWTWSENKKSKYDYDQTMWQWGTVKVGGMNVDANICFVNYPSMTAEWYATHVTISESKSVEEVAREVLGGNWGNGVDRKERLLNAGYDYDSVQTEVNRILSASVPKPIDDIAVEVVRGLWGNGEDRKQRLTAAGYDPKKIQERVNELIKL